MMISTKSKTTIDACRFCWMCRHICPIGNVTGQERNNARGRAVSLSLVERGAAELSDVIDNVYECALCGACTNDCATGWDPVAFTKEVRLEAALNGVTPEYINKLLDNIDESGNPYGKNEISKELADEIAVLPEKADVLLFLGQDARYIVPDAAINAIKLMKKAGINFTVLMDEPDSGYALDTLVGAAEETRQVIQKAAETLNQYKTIVAFDPADAKVFLREYKEWNIPINAEIKTFTTFLAGLIEDGELMVRKLDLAATFQDPALLARDLDETEDARKILNACVELKEMLLCKKDTVWAGNLLMSQWLPDVMAKTSLERWRQAVATGADALITASPSEYAVLSKTKPDGMQLLTLEEIVLKALKED